MKQQTKWFATAAAVLSGLAMANSVQAQSITGTPYLSNLDPDNASFTGNWATTATIMSTLTGLEFQAAGGTFSTMYYPIFMYPSLVTPLNPADNQVTFDFTWNSGTLAPGLGAAVVFALGSNGGANYYSTGYGTTFTAGTTYSYTFPLQALNLADVSAGNTIGGLNFQIDPGNVSGNYDITYNSLTLTPTPEPATLALVGLGAAGLVAFRRRK